MYTLKIILKLLLNTFSLKRKSLRFISLKRIIAVLILYPLFTALITVNWVFLLLDEMLFPSYRKTEIKKAVFIIGVPRSATTFLFNLLYRDESNFHGFKLWELVFAPSVCQKYLFLSLIKLDSYIGRPIYRMSLLFDRIVFGKFRGIHDIGLTKPEEDEALFLYNFSSLFLCYFYPELRILDSLLYYDQKVPEKVKKRNINFYYRCIQRHKYVFDRMNEKYFLSKNPTFIPKIESIARKFENAYIIYPLRSPFKTIPSTISLNSRIYSAFSKMTEAYPLAEKTRDIILDWYVKADTLIKDEISGRTLTVYYKEIINDPAQIIMSIYHFLNLELKRINELINFINLTAKDYVSPHKYNNDIGIDRELINNRLGNIITPEIIERI